jgi:hypothetical protein
MTIGEAPLAGFLLPDTLDNEAVSTMLAVIFSNDMNSSSDNVILRGGKIHAPLQLLL